MTKSKIPNKSKIQNSKLKFWHLTFVIYALSFVIATNALALNLDKLKACFLSGDYTQAINEGEKILAASEHSEGIDELYYLLGLSYLKDRNYLRASDIFEIILKEFKKSAFQEEAKLGLGDTYFLRGDFAKAKDYYQEIINSNPATKLKAQAYYRLSEAGYKTGDAQFGKEYLDKLKQEFPSSPEARLSRDLYGAAELSDFYYTVQVGAFSNLTNAKNLNQKLIQQGYPAYMEEAGTGIGATYRVRVGKVHLRKEVEDLEKRLTYDGYPTKICP